MTPFMKAGVENRVEALSSELLEVLLDEAERVLLEVEARSDQPHQRLTSHDPLGGEEAELRLAIAELSDAYPAMGHDLEAISERLHQTGPKAASQDLELHPHILHVVRLSLEIHFRQYPTLEEYDAALRAQREDSDEELLPPGETYETLRRLLGFLRTRVS